MEEQYVVDPVIEEIKIPAADDPLIDSRCARRERENSTQESLSSAHLVNLQLIWE